MQSTKPAASGAMRTNVFVNTAPFWEGIAEGRLVLQYCNVAHKFQHYPRPVSIYTGRRTLEWREVSGNGCIYACTVVRVGPPSMAQRLPLCVATIELDEGVRLLGNILACAPEDLAIGKRVKLTWDQLSETQRYPAFVMA